ncbi:Wzz/FepE/Etk N-terminal domain-containing protein [Aquifex sp.]
MLKKLRADLLFFLIVVLPTLFAVLYNLFIATPVYISEARIIVKSLQGGETSLGLSSLLGAIGVMHPSTYGAYLVMNYIKSRDVMFKLDKKYHLKNYYSSEEWDILRRFDPLNIDPSYENFYRYYTQKVVSTSFDPNSGIVTLKVRAKDPKYCRNIAEELIKLSEEFVNLINKRASMTALGYYKEKLEEARKKLKEFSEKVKDFLVNTKTVLPEQQVAVLLQTIAQLQAQLIAKQIQLSTIRLVAPQSPLIKTLEMEIKGIKKEIDKLTKQMVGKKGSLATHSVELELLKSELMLLQKEVELNLQAFLSAENQAYLQHLFIETVEKPIEPDAPMEPEKSKNIFVVFSISFALWGVLSLLIAGVKEHIGE